ncbi:YggS family pyridoxal phosphate-dependent enzyme [Rhodoluna limnophila]|uniref:YggS family pyridoxal phosphate-dependent enzyme n=1 Tax=Rhodoluna limnophila TaxID=232537 RepID=UPI001FE5ABC1|nr:YggS family pyridoxal phosphate-dependent enzyme [Rhodoluna limnophila]
MSQSGASLRDRYFDVVSRIESAALSAGRDSSEVELVVISKNHPASMVVDLAAMGARNFGENRDQEARPKSEEVSAAGVEGITWHFVGQLQSNKAKSALSYAKVLHSLDRESLLTAVAKAAIDLPEPVQVFIQLNLTDDPGRGGIQPARLEEFANRVLSSPNVVLLGVMGVAALDRPPAQDFETIRRASQKLQTIQPSAKFISAGMSEDFEEAIAFGATHVRVGSAITGKRQY